MILVLNKVMMDFDVVNKKRNFKIMNLCNSCYLYCFVYVKLF